MLEAPTSGEVIVDGIDLTTPQAKSELQRSVVTSAWSFSNTSTLLSSRTVFTNVALPLELVGKDKAAIEAKSEWATWTCWPIRTSVTPIQLTWVAVKSSVLIALRALASDPKVLLCDEATSAPRSCDYSIYPWATAWNQPQAEIHHYPAFITHEMDVVKSICHEVAIIGGG